MTTSHVSHMMQQYDSMSKVHNHNLLLGENPRISPALGTLLANSMIHCNAILKESLGRRRYAASTRRYCQGFKYPYSCDLQHYTPCKGDVVLNYIIQSNLGTQILAKQQWSLLWTDQMYNNFAETHLGGRILNPFVFQLSIIVTWIDRLIRLSLAV